MCEPVGENDSRGKGYYCCECNSYTPSLPCRKCGKTHRIKKGDKS